MQLPSYHNGKEPENTASLPTAPPLVGEDEYLGITYRPDCDYVDGIVLERNLGQFDHARLQALILFLFMQNESAWGIVAVPECRLKIRPRKYRIPDVMVLSKNAPRPPVIEEAPLLCVEVVSPDDRLKDQVDRARDYVVLGVQETWIFDPQTKSAYVYSQTGLREVPADQDLRCGAIVLNPASLFVQINAE
jgi:Uma2 family endonuclease